MKSVELVRRELEAFCELAIRRGWRLKAGGLFHAEKKTCCPFGAADIVLDPNSFFCGKCHHSVCPDDRARRGVKVGFDGVLNPRSLQIDDWYRLGQWFRERYFVGNPAVIEVAWEPELHYYVDLAATDKRGVWRVFDTTLEKALDGAHRLLGTAPRGAVEGKLRIKSDQGWVSR